MHSLKFERGARCRGADFAGGILKLSLLGTNARDLYGTDISTRRMVRKFDMMFGVMWCVESERNISNGELWTVVA